MNIGNIPQQVKPKNPIIIIIFIIIIINTSVILVWGNQKMCVDLHICKHCQKISDTLNTHLKTKEDNCEIN